MFYSPTPNSQLLFDFILPGGPASSPLPTLLFSQPSLFLFTTPLQLPTNPLYALSSNFPFFFIPHHHQIHTSPL